MMASRSLLDLDPRIYPLAEKFHVCCDNQGISIIFTCTRRSNREQAALYAQGRSPLSDVNELRQAAGLRTIGTEENSKTVTDALPGESLHEIGMAFDVVPLEAGKPIWDTRSKLWQRLGEIGESCGLEWAGRWKRRREFPHFQLKPKE